MAVLDRKTVQYDLYTVFATIKKVCADLHAQDPHRYMLGTGRGDMLHAIWYISEATAGELDSIWHLGQER